MSSREIAKITGKRHDHVLADIRKMIGRLGVTPPEFSGDLPYRAYNRYLAQENSTTYLALG